MYSVICVILCGEVWRSTRKIALGTGKWQENVYIPFFQTEWNSNCGDGEGDRKWGNKNLVDPS